MWTLAWKNFLKERVRLLISVGGVAFSVMLIVMLRGLFISYEHRAGRYFDHIGGNAWVWQRDTASVFNSFSLVPMPCASRLAGSQEWQVRPFVIRPVGITVNGAQTSQLIVGFDLRDPVTGPVRLIRGTLNVGSDGIIVDDVFVQRYGVELGNRLTVLGHRLTIVGVSAEGDMVLYQYAFVSMP
jgi:putative ABC transport system permease protein